MTPQNVFVVDDADFMVDMLRLILEEGGHRVVGSAADGIRAVEQLREVVSRSLTVDVVLVDLYMPKRDGFETVREIRAILPDVKVLLVTANATLPVALKAKELGIDGFIVKPFEPETLLEALRKIIFRRSDKFRFCHYYVFG